MITNRGPAPRSLGEVGFSLIEVLVFITVLSLFFVVGVAVTVFNLRNMHVQEHKILATRYAEEAMEWIKQEKEESWETFSGHGNGSGISYCLNSLEIDVWSNPSDCGSDYALGPPNIFKRVLIVTSSGNPYDKVTVNLKVNWLENNIEQNIVLKSVFNLWE